MNDSKISTHHRKASSKAKNTPRQISKRRKSKNAYDDRGSSRHRRIQVSFDGHCDQIFRDPQYTNLVIKNKQDNNRSRDSKQSKESKLINEKDRIELKYLRHRIDDETERRKKAENERDILIKSLDDMTNRAKKLEKTIGELETENSEVYERLNQSDQDIIKINKSHDEMAKQLAELRVECESSKIENLELKRTIDNQQLLIGRQSIEITQLKTTNQAFDMSNKENMRNMGAVMSKIVVMNNERQKMTHELDHIIKRRKSVKSLACSNSLQHLPQNQRIYTNNPSRLLKDCVSNHY